MGTPAVAVQGTEELEQEQQSIETELAGLRDKVRTEQSTLARLKGEQVKLIEAIGMKREKPSKATEVAAEISGCESVIVGLNAIIAPKEKRFYEIVELVRKLSGQKQRADEVGAIATLRTTGETLLIRIGSNLEKTIGADLRELNLTLDRLDRANRQGVSLTQVTPVAMAAREARKHLSKLMLEKLGPLVKLLR